VEGNREEVVAKKMELGSVRTTEHQHRTLSPPPPSLPALALRRSHFPVDGRGESRGSEYLRLVNTGDPCYY
jgi:hypothetical protein